MPLSNPKGVDQLIKKKRDTVPQFSFRRTGGGAFCDLLSTPTDQLLAVLLKKLMQHTEHCPGAAIEGVLDERPTGPNWIQAAVHGKNCPTAETLFLDRRQATLPKPLAAVRSGIGL